MDESVESQQSKIEADEMVAVTLTYRSIKDTSVEELLQVLTSPFGSGPLTLTFRCDYCDYSSNNNDDLEFRICPKCSGDSDICKSCVLRNSTESCRFCFEMSEQGTTCHNDLVDNSDL